MRNLYAIAWPDEDGDGYVVHGHYDLLFAEDADRVLAEKFDDSSRSDIKAKTAARARAGKLLFRELPRPLAHSPRPNDGAPPDPPAFDSPGFISHIVEDNAARVLREYALYDDLGWLAKLSFVLSRDSKPNDCYDDFLLEHLCGNLWLLYEDPCVSRSDRGTVKIERRSCDSLKVFLPADLCVRDKTGSDADCRVPVRRYTHAERDKAKRVDPCARFAKVADVPEYVQLHPRKGRPHSGSSREEDKKSLKTKYARFGRCRTPPTRSTSCT